MLWEAIQAQLSAKLSDIAVVKPIVIIGSKCLQGIGFLAFIFCLHPHQNVNYVRQWISVNFEWESHLDFTYVPCNLLRVSITGWQCPACHPLLLNRGYKHNTSNSLQRQWWGVIGCGYHIMDCSNRAWGVTTCAQHCCLVGTTGFGWCFSCWSDWCL